MYPWLRQGHIKIQFMSLILTRFIGIYRFVQVFSSEVFAIDPNKKLDEKICQQKLQIFAALLRFAFVFVLRLSHF